MGLDESGVGFFLEMLEHGQEVKSFDRLLGMRAVSFYFMEQEIFMHIVNKSSS